MHDTAMAAGAAFFEAYVTGARPRILDVGSMNVNGSLRSLAPQGADYVGLDLEPGPGVDVVLEGTTYPFEADSFDACVSVSCLEHDAAFWDTFLEIARVTRPGGFVFLDVPSNGPYHAYPHDNWRFYPDAGLALARWALRAGQPMQLVESGTLRRRADVWNDLVMVFHKSAEPVRPGRFLLDAFPDATNVRRIGEADVINPVADTEDVRITETERRRAAGLEEALREAHAALAEAQAVRAGMEAQHAEELRRQARAMAEVMARLSAVTGEVSHLTPQVARLATLEAEHSLTRERLARIEQSRSWRLTQPLRRLRGWLSPAERRARD